MTPYAALVAGHHRWALIKRMSATKFVGLTLKAKCVPVILVQKCLPVHSSSDKTHVKASLLEQWRSSSNLF